MHLFCPSSSAWQSEGFVRWLSSQHKTHNTIREIIIYSKKYGSILDTGDASPLLELSPRNRHHVLCSMANLAKYTGRYDKFQQLRHRYALKWSSGNNSLQSLERFFNPDLTLDVMLQKVREMMQVLPTDMAVVIRFAVLTGLRPSEACESVRLLNSSFSRIREKVEYYNPTAQCLEQFRFPQFLRQTKKAYISFITLDNLQPIVNLGSRTPTWTAIRLTCRRRGINCNMRYTRKLFASHLRHEGIQPEVVDLLQGRVPTSVLTRPYLAPPTGLRERVFDAVASLEKKILIL